MSSSVAGLLAASPKSLSLGFGVSEDTSYKTGSNDKARSRPTFGRATQRLRRTATLCSTDAYVFGLHAKKIERKLRRGRFCVATPGSTCASLIRIEVAVRRYSGFHASISSA